MKKMFLDFIKKGWKAIFMLVAFELFVVFITGKYPLHDGASQRFLVDLTQNFAPVIAKINAKPWASTEAIRFYMAITFYLFILKVTIFYTWLNRGGDSKKQLVISPMTTEHAGSVDEYIKAPLKNKNELEETKPRSMFSRVFWSILIVAFALGMAYANLDGGTPIEGEKSSIEKAFDMLNSGGLALWMQWSVKGLTFLAFLIAIATQTIKGYADYFKQK